MNRRFAIVALLLAVVSVFAFSNSSVDQNAQTTPPDPMFTSTTM